MCTTNFLGIIGAKPGDDETCQSVARTTAHFEKVLRVFDERADADARRLSVALAVRRLEYEVAVVVIPLWLVRREWRRRCCCYERRRVKVCSRPLARRRIRKPNTDDA